MNFGILENFGRGVKGVSVGFKGALFSSTELRPSVRIIIDGTPLSVSKFFSMSKVFWFWTKTLKKIYQSYKLIRLESFALFAIIFSKISKFSLTSQRKKIN